MKNLSKQNLRYLRKLVMVFAIIITVFLASGFSARLSSASARPIETLTSGPLAASLEARSGIITIDLLGVTSQELTEIFNDIIETTPGVIKTRCCQLYLDPEHPRSGRVEWQVTFNNTTPFALEGAIYQRLKEITGNCVTSYLANGFMINLTERECAALAAIKPGQATSHTLCFIEMNVFADNSPARWEYNPRRIVNDWSKYPNRGFE